MLTKAEMPVACSDNEPGVINSSVYAGGRKVIDVTIEEATAQAARSGRAHARRLVVKLAAETPERGKFPVNFPVSREFGADTGSHPTASSGTAHM